MKVRAVSPSSPLFGQVRRGYDLVAVNDEPVRDVIDFTFMATAERVKLRFLDHDNHPREFELGAFLPGALGLAFAEDPVRTCKCKCIFCFVHQQPKGLRRTLYVRDEDYRLSFLSGNYLTLSNLTDADYDRIITQRLSPLYVSVHSTDDNLRRRMLRNQTLPPVLSTMSRLIRGGIALHAQVVVCPGWNDGENLRKTIADMAELSPGVQTLAIVPVGLTRYRERLTHLRRPDRDEARDTLDIVHEFQVSLQARLGTRFVWAADEYYLLADERLPLHGAYEDFAQFENGVGALRHTLTRFNTRRRILKKVQSSKRVLMLTGTAAAPILQAEVVDWARGEANLELKLTAVANRFWGEMVTVSGLLTGRDLLDVALAKKRSFDTLVLPPNCVSRGELFLDDMALSQFRDRCARKKVLVGDYDLAETLKEAFR